MSKQRTFSSNTLRNVSLKYSEVNNTQKWTKTNAQEDTKQNESIVFIIKTLTDYLSVLKTTQKNLLEINQEDHQITKTAQNIAKRIDSFLENRKQGFARLIYMPDVSSLTQHVVNANFPDPIGILGKNSEIDLFSLLEKRRIQEQTLNKAASASSITFAGQSQASIPQTNNITRELLQNITEMPITISNYLDKIEKGFENKDIPEEEVRAYKDACASFFNSLNDKKPADAFKDAKDEFIQNLRLLIIQTTTHDLLELVKEIYDELKQLPDGGLSFSRKIGGGLLIQDLETQLAAYNGNISAREIDQNLIISQSLSQLSTIAEHFMHVSDSFNLKCGSYLSHNFTHIGLIFGGNPNSRLDKNFLKDNERPSLLHDFAKKGDYQTTWRLLVSGADSNSLSVPIQTWGEWFYSWRHTPKMMYNWFFSQRAPEELGRTPLLEATEQLLKIAQSNKDDNKREIAYLETVILLLDFDSNPYIADKRGNYPHNKIEKYLAIREGKTDFSELSIKERLLKVAENLNGFKEIHGKFTGNIIIQEQRANKEEQKGI